VEFLSCKFISNVGRILSQKAELADLETITRYVGDLSVLLSESSLAERTAFIRSFAKEVKVTGNEVLLAYTIPAPPERISQEKVGVPSPVHSGGVSSLSPRLLVFYYLIDSR